MTIVVWVLILWTGNGPVVVDNIASEKNCLGLVNAYHRVEPMGGGRCLAVRKVVPR